MAGKAPASSGTEACPGDLANLIEQLLAATAMVGRQPLAATIGPWLDATAAWSGITTWEGAMGVACARAYLELLAQAEAGLPETTFAQADFNLPEAFQPPAPRAQDSPVEILDGPRRQGARSFDPGLPALPWTGSPCTGEDKIPPFLLGGDSRPPASTGLALARPYVQEQQGSLYLLLKRH